MNRTRRVDRCAALGLIAVALAACTSPSPPRGPCAAGKPLGSVCGFENPEDVAYAPAAGVVLASEMLRNGKGGFLAALVPGAPAPRRVWPTGGPSDFAAAASAGDPSCARPDPAALKPHGIALDEAGRLWAVNHGGRESIEIFAPGGQGEALYLTWIGCIVLPPGTAANDLQPTASGGVVASNFGPTLESPLVMLKIMTGMQTGDVMRWEPGAGWTHIPGSGASGANGVAISPDGKYVFYAETGGGRVVRLGLADGGRAEAAIVGRPDNLSWTQSGKLLVATHRSGWKFIACARGQTCRSEWSLFEIDPATMHAKELLAHDGDVVGAVASATETPQGVYLGAVFGDRVGVWTKPD